MDPKLHASSTSSPPPKAKNGPHSPRSPRSNTPPRPTPTRHTPARASFESPLKRPQGASPRPPTLASSPRPVVPSPDSLMVPQSAEKVRKRPLAKTKSFVFSKSFDETKQFKTRDSAVWSPSHSSNRGAILMSPDSSLTGRQSIDETHESVDDLQLKLKKNTVWKDQYVELKRLHDLIGKIKKDYLHAEQEFATALAGQVTKVDMFYRRLVAELLQSDRVFQVAYDADELAKFIQNIEDFALLNTAILKNVVHVHDLNSVLRLKPSYAWTLRRDDFCQPALLFPLFIQLSSTYHSASVSPSNIPITPAFRRTSSVGGRGVKVSVWVPQNQVVTFIIKVLSHMPVYNTDMFAIPHTSVYFDDAEFKGYQAYVSSSNTEAALTCFRWMGLSPPDVQVYVDQKKVEAGRHITRQVGTLPHSLVGDFLKNSPEEANAELKQVYAENPSLAEFHADLAALRPTLKVEHFRTWFGNERLKIRLCTQLTILRELDQAQLRKLNEWTTPSERIQEQRIHRFPFALVTVHSQSLVLPNWLSELVDKYDRQDRFSTYPHGVAMLYEKVASQYGRPTWLSGSLANLFLKPLPQDEKTKEQTAAGYFKHSRSEMQMQLRTNELQRLRSHSVSEYMRAGSVDLGSSANGFELRGSDLSAYRNKQHFFRGADPSMLPLITRTDALLGQGSPDSRHEEKRESEPEVRPLLPRSSVAGVPKPVRKPSTVEKPDAQKVGNKRSAEHKTYFANERTYMQWFNAAILLSTVGLALLNSVHSFLRIVAYCFPVIAILVLCYAYRMYRLRIHTLDQQLSTDKFADMQGPCCLTTIVSILFLVVLILMAVRDTQAPPLVYQVNPAGLLLQHPAIVAPECNPGFSFPSSSIKGMSYNSSNQELWGVSDSQVFQLHVSTGLAYRFFPQDTALHVGLLGVAVAEKPSLIYVGKQDGFILSIDTYTKQVVDLWKLGDLASLSAFTFIPGNVTGYFYVATAMAEHIKVFIVPATKQSSLVLHTTFVPIPSAQAISALAFLPRLGGLLVNGLSPKALVLYGISSGLPTSVLRVLPGFDAKHVLAITPYSDSQVLVLGANSSTLLLYHLDPLLFTYADCLKTR